MKSFTRRRLLQTAALATAATQITPALSAAPAATQPAWPENGTLVPDEGWRLWIDDKAEWQNDEIYLPEDVSWIDGKLCGKGQPLPVNEPTGGWGTLRKNDGLEVILPTTVEQHFWGKYGAGTDGKPRPYTPEEYRYAKAPAGAPADDDIPQNGAYFGVSWWGREIEIPEAMRGKRIFLHIRGARLRAEVYLNKKLVGYSIMEELPFECDLTHAADPGGFNLIAIRLTNPFGRFDWVDGSNAKWGKLALYRSHGFAGLDRGITISTHVGLRITDAYVLNSLDPHKAKLYVTTVADDDDGVVNISYSVVDPATGSRVDDHFNPALGSSISATISVACYDGIHRDGSVRPGTCRTLSPQEIKDSALTASKGYPRMDLDGADVISATARSWSLENPKLYHLVIVAKSRNGRTDTRAIPFGFRTFAPTGTGTNAIFRLNGRRIRLYTAISWGFWGLNGLFPVPELAEKEVVAAKQLGLNCLNFHRNLAKEDVLRKHDELGLLRYMEPGAGKLAIGKLPEGAASNAPSVIMEKPTTEADKFAQRYMFVKCVEMVKAYRSHPSVIEYCLQNEIGADLNNPDTLAILKAMHDEDPSRCVVLNDGFVAAPRKAAQAWYEPWDSELKPGKLHRSDEEPWGGWWNQHQGAGDQWYDAFYKSPTDFTYRAPFKDVITEFGEMEGCARPDNHPLMVHQIKEAYKKYGGDSYDLTDHEEILSGYERFIAKWGFRSAFPTAESLFLALGRTEYESWQNYLENVRISEDLDFAAISGWESTAIENHSGIVDNLRNFKSDPNLIASSLLPVRPIAKQRSMCVGPDEPFVFDLYLANDTSKSVDGELIFSVVDPKNNTFEIGRYKVPAQTPDQFSYLVAESVQWQPKHNPTVPYFYEGGYTFKFALSTHQTSTQVRTLWMTATKLKATVGLRIATSGISADLRTQLAKNFEFSDFKPGEKYDLIITAGLTTHTKTDGQIGETTGESMPVAKPGHVLEPGEAPEAKQLGHIDPAVLEAARAGTPLLVIPQTDNLSDGCAAQLAAAGAFTYTGSVGDFRAPWMGNWYFVRQHPLFEGMPVDQAMGSFYQAPGRQSNGLLVEQAPAGPNVEIVVGYSRDHDCKIGAGTFTTRLGKGKLLYHRVPPMHPVLQQRFLANAIRWLTT